MTPGSRQTARFTTAVVALMTLFAWSAHGQKAARQLQGDGAPCCKVKAIDVKASLVTAEEYGSGVTFTFRASKSMLLALKVGQQVTTSEIASTVSAFNLRWPMGGLPHCPCGKMPDSGKCWCSRHPGDACFKIGCPYGALPGAHDEPTRSGPPGATAALQGECLPRVQQVLSANR